MELLVPASPAHAQKADFSGIEITVLSSAAGRSSAYLLRHGEALVLVDCGPGTALTLARNGLLDQLDAVLITHEHADHAADLIGLAYARRFPDPMAKIPLLAPDSTLEVLHHLDELFAVPTLPQMRNTIASAFEPEPLSGTTVTVADGLTVRAHAVSHAVPSMALRFTAGPQTVTFSSDTGPCDALIEAAENADLLLCEATYLHATQEQLEGHGHLTPALAAKTAHLARATRLALTHLSRPHDAPAAIAAAQRHTEPTTVSAATDGTLLQISAAEITP
ncbi:MAG TPA: MBL fold metallo-hydrolase [Streptosporangiaceae bacterium]|jgi:ribonuclease BN (tRNA processing enzyme)|nr:MBL fold metallo-hydrolase [Streptosporangiaceae bacterium]